MLTLISCPTCHHKFPVSESSAGQRRTCPNCESIFVAEKSAPARRGLLERAADEQAAARSPIDRTMLAEVDVPIRYNCPRCRTALEAPSIEAGTKKPCPSCGGRLQVPAAAAPASPGLNKTMLADVAPARYSPAPAAPTPVAPQIPGRPPAPGALGEHGWKFAVGGLAAAAVVLLALTFGGRGAVADPEQEKVLQAQKLELEKFRADIEAKTAQLQQQQEVEAKQRKEWQEALAKQEARQRELDRERELEIRRATALNNEQFLAETKARLEQKQRELEAEKKKAEEQQAKVEREMREQMDLLKKQLEAAKTSAGKAGTGRGKLR